MLEMASFMVTPASYWDYQTQSRSATDAWFRIQSLNDSIIMLADSITEALNMCFESLLEQMKDKMPDKFLLPISKDDEKQWAKISKEDIELNSVYEWSSDSIREADKATQRAQLPEVINAISMAAQDENWRSLLDRDELMKYIVELWDMPWSIVKSKNEFYDDLREAQIKQTEIQQEIATAQQEAQVEAMQEQQETAQISEALWTQATESDIDLIRQMMTGNQ